MSRFSSDSEQWHFEVRAQSGCICCGPVAECVREGKGEDPEEEAGSVQLWHRAAAEGLWAANFRQDPGQSEGKGVYTRPDVSVRHLWKLRLDGWLKARGRNSRQETNRLSPKSMPMVHTQLDGDGRDGDADAQRCLVELDAEQIGRINNQGWMPGY